MGIFFYKAMDENGSIIEGYKEATSKEEVLKFIESKGFLPLIVREQSKQSSKLKTFLQFLAKAKRRKVTKKDVIMFTQSLSLLLKSGIPLDKALVICMETIENKSFINIIKDIREEIRQGASFSNALSKYPNIFSRLYINTVKAGETTGVLPEVLERIYNHMLKIENFKTTLINSIIYPVFLLIVSIFSIAILVIFVVPRFYIIFSSTGVTPPFPIPQLAMIGSFFSKYGVFVLLIMLFIIGGLIWWFKNPIKRQSILPVILKFPFVGSLMKKMENIKFSRNLGVLIVNGVPILQAIMITKEMFSNPVLRKEMENLYRLVREGKKITFVLETRKDLWHPIVIGMAGVGEESGLLGEMLIKASEVLEQDVEVRLKRIVAMIEPAAILTMGLIVGSIVVSMISAIFSINEFVR